MLAATAAVLLTAVLLAAATLRLTVRLRLRRLLLLVLRLLLRRLVRPAFAIFRTTRLLRRLVAGAGLILRVLLGGLLLRRRGDRAGAQTRAGAHGAVADRVRVREGLEVRVRQGGVQDLLPDLGGLAGAVHVAARGAEDRAGAVGRADPHRGGQLRRRADHPRVLVLTRVAHLRGTGLRGGLAPTSQRAIGVGGDRLHGLDDIVGHLGGHAALGVVRVLVKYVAVRGLDLLHEVGLVPGAAVGQGGHRGGHVHRTRLVLAQHDALVRRLAVLGQRVLDARHRLRHAEGVGHVRGVLHLVAQVVLQTQEGRVERLLRRLRNRAGAARVAVGVLHDLRARQLVRRRGVLSVQADALLQRGRQRHDLERGAGLQRRVGVVPAGRVVATEVAADRARLRVNGHRCRARVLLQRGEVLIHGIDRRLLDVHVDGGLDVQPAGGHILLSEADALQLLHHVGLDVAVRAGRFDVRRVVLRVLGVRELHPGALLRREIAHLNQAVEDVIPAVLGGLPVVFRVQGARRLNHAGEHRAFLRGELLGRLVKVGLRRRLDAIGVAPVVDGVEVGVEDLFLGPLVGHLHRVDQLTHLAGVRVCVAHQGVFHVLLGNRRAAAGGVIAGQLADGRAREAGEGKAGVGPELAVLRGERGVFHLVGDFVQIHVRAVALRRHDARQLGLTVGCVDGGNLLAGHLFRFGHVVARVRDAEHDERDRDERQQHEADDPRPTPLLPAVLVLFAAGGNRSGSVFLIVLGHR